MCDSKFKKAEWNLNRKGGPWLCTLGGMAKNKWRKSNSSVTADLDWWVLFTLPGVHEGFKCTPSTVISIRMKLRLSHIPTFHLNKKSYWFDINFYLFCGALEWVAAGLDLSFMESLGGTGTHPGELEDELTNTPDMLQTGNIWYSAAFPLSLEIFLVLVELFY